jgi:hypothetical protein
MFYFNDATQLTIFIFVVMSSHQINESNSIKANDD